MKLDTDRVMSLTAVIVGVGSLFIIVYQTTLLREQQKASVLPYLMIAMQSNPDRSYVSTRNTGVGPALVEDVIVHYRGRDIRKDPYDFYLEVHPEAAQLGLSVDKVIPGRLISAGEWVNMLGTDGDRAPLMARDLLSLFDLGEVPQSWYDGVGVPKSSPDKAIIEIIYTSVYGERWHVTSDRVVPERL